MHHHHFLTSNGPADAQKKESNLRCFRDFQHHGKCLENIAHGTAICHNQPLHNFTGDRKNLTNP
jgi:hypothetical protein